MPGSGKPVAASEAESDGRTFPSSIYCDCDRLSIFYLLSHAFFWDATE